MKNRYFAMVVLACGLMLFGNAVVAADKDQDRTRDQTQLQDKSMIYGYQLMTVEERAQHRAKIRSLKTEQEREAYRQEHHKLMQARARERGVTLPEVPVQRGSGSGPGSAGGGRGR